MQFKQLLPSKASRRGTQMKQLFYFLISMLMAIHLFITMEDVQGQTAESDLEIIRELVIADLIESESDAVEVERLMRSARADGTWPDIDYEDVSRNAFEHSRHLNNMVELSRVYKKPGSKYYQDLDLKEVITSALDYWLEHDFICENWWWNQMGTPGRMVNVLLMMDDELTESQKIQAAPIVGRANLEASGARPGGDLIQIAGIYGKYGLFARDVEIVEEAIQAMAGEIGFAPDRGDPSDVRGLQVDFSFHHRHDRVPYTLTYGMGYTRSFADWASKVAGTRFAFPDEAIELLVDFFLDGIVRTSAWGKYPDPGALSREVARRTILDAYGPEIPEQLLQATSYRKEELEKVVDIRKSERKHNLTSSTYFWHSEYFSHQRPDYFTSVRMYSSRNHNLDRPHNGEGLLNHHLADGSNFIIRTGEEYPGIFPVWDWQKIPGTTIVQKPSLPEPDQIQQRGLTDFVGGVSNGKFGAVAFDFESPIDPLKARKSWFFFDDEFVSLGSGISSNSEYPVATTLNQSLLFGDVKIGDSQGERIMNEGEHNLDEVSWIHHDNTAYLFPEANQVRLENRQRSGSWQEINDQSWTKALEEEKKEVFTLWLDHGVAPRQGNYEYIVVPGIDASDVEDYQASSPVVILANNPQIQAVQHKSLNITQIVFYEPGEIEISDGVTITAETPGMVMVKKSVQDNIEEITVSDPARKLDSYNLNISTLLEVDGSQWETTRSEEGGSTSLRIQLPDGEYAGQSVSVKITR